MTIIDYFFGATGMGSFERTLCDAWKLASSGNRETLENAFPEHFPKERMYFGGHDFREYAYREQYDEAWDEWYDQCEVEQYYRDLTDHKCAWVSLDYRQQVVDYCESRGVVVCGGAIHHDNEAQLMYVE